MTRETKSYFSGLTRNTFLLAFASLFADIATEMLYPVLPIFLTQILGAPASIVGIVEGVATATQNIVQGFSGYIADRLQKRKTVALVGYLFAALAKPLIGLSANWTQVLGSRFLDRFATGTRSAPRDALIASSTDEKHRGKAFGLEGIGDNLGAFLGPILAIILLSIFHISIRSIFSLAFIPGILALCMIFLIREKRIIDNSVTKIETHFEKFPKEYWKYLFVTAVFGIGNASNAFLILRARNVGIPLIQTIFIYAFFNLVAALISYPSGHLSDVLGRKNILLFSFIIFIITYAGFAVSSNFFVLGFLFVLYGLFSGIFRAVGKALATDLIPQSLRASGIGWYATTVGISSLIASSIAGQLWTKINPNAAFLYGVVFAIAGSILLILMIDGKK